MVTNLPDLFLGVAFNADPFDTGVTPTWSDLTARAYRIGQAWRGRQYELDQNQAAQMDVTWRNADEALNPVNSGSPYSPNVLPYRAVLARCMWPNGGTGNLLNATAFGSYGVDPSFESYTNGAAAPSWVLTVGGVTPVTTTTNPQQGTKCLTFTQAGTSTQQGVGWVVPCIPGRQYTASAYVRQTAANTQQIFVNGGAAGSTTAATGAYVRLTVTFVATQPTHQVWVSCFVPTLADTVNVDAIQHEPGGAANAFTTTGPMVRNLWPQGYVERWPAQWDPDSQGFKGQTTTPCVGPFAILNNADLRSDYVEALLAKAPDYYWPLWDAAGSTVFAEASGHSGLPPLVPYTSPYGPVAYTAGSQSQVPGDPGGVGVLVPNGTGGGLTRQTGTCLGTGPRVSNTPPVALPASLALPWTVSMSCWVLCSSTPPANNVAFVLPMTSFGGQLFYFPCDIGINSTTGQPLVGYSGESSELFVYGTGNLLDGKPHLLVGVATQDATNTTVTIYLDGVQAGANTATTASLGGPLAHQCRDLLVGAYTDMIALYNGGCNGVVSHVAVWNRAVTAGEVTDLWSAGGLGRAGETSGARISRYLSLGGWTGATNIQPGASTMGAGTVRTGDAVLASCQAVADSEFGNFVEETDGLTFLARTDRYLKTTPTFVFGERADLGEYPYETDVEFDYDPTRVINIADVTQAGGVKAHAEDTTGASQKRYGKRNFTRTVSVRSPYEAIDAANWTVATRKDASLRVSALTFNPAAVRNLPFGDGTLWPMVLDLRIGTRVTVNRRPKAANAGAGITMSGDYFVEYVAHHSIDAAAGTWKTTVILSPVVRQNPLIFDSSTYGLFNSGFFGF